MASKQLGYRAPPSLAIAEGAGTPNPGLPGVEVWSTTLGKLVHWTGTQWTAGVSGGGGGDSTALTVSLASLGGF